MEKKAGAKNSETKELIDSVVVKVSQIVSEMAGIQLGARQSSMVESRLRSRMIKLGISGFSIYLEYLDKHREEESQALLSLMTTHHTYFFREFAHFEHLISTGLPTLISVARARPDKQIRVWSSACSRGQEVYSLAMFLNVHLKVMAPDVTFKIWGTDIDPESVNFAKNGVYRNDEVQTSPAIYVGPHWIRGKGEVAGFSKVKDVLRRQCEFSPLNLLDSDSFLKGKEFDIIFCRNVFIYFNQDQIKHITRTFAEHLNSSGFIYLGISESLNGLGLPLDLTGPSIYRHKVTQQGGTRSVAPVIKTTPEKREISVLAVDDSPTILALLKKILSNQHGFRIGATAKNGREALEIVAKNKFDIILLDLHMPELDGIGFLKAFKDPKTPVVIVSAINRDDPAEAQLALKLGAVDYVEKPSLENLVEAGDEIRAKIKTILSAMPSSPSSSSSSAPPSSGPVGASSPAMGFQEIGSKKIKVLVVDDSPTICQLLTQIISKSPSLEVIGTLGKPSEVEPFIKANRPDVITLDINMPEMDGVSLLKKLHPLYGIPTVMISSISREEGPQVLNALEMGAVDYIQKPQYSNLKDAAEMICDRLKIAAQANLMKGPRLKKMSYRRLATEQLSEMLIVIGASTGGTEAIRHVFESLPKEIPPILVVQHIPPIFSGAFATRLNEICPFEVKEAKNGDEIKPNLVLIAPGGCQMGVRSGGGKLFVSVNDDPPMTRHKPSVDYLFKTTAQQQLKQVVAVIMTGMGSDGAKEMKVLRDAGARTIGQDAKTSVVYGMPREAANVGAVEFQLPIEEIASKIIELVEKGPALARPSTKKVS